MKRTAIIIIFIFILAAIVVSPSLASSSYQESTPTSTPTTAPTPTPVQWKVYAAGSYPDTYDDLTMDDPLDVVMTANDGYGLGGGTEHPTLSAGIVCTGVDCAKRDIYYSIDLDASWVTLDSDSYLGDRNLYLEIQYSPSKTITVIVPCGGGVSGECSFENVNGVIPEADLYWNEGNERNLNISINLWGGAFNLEDGDQSVTSAHIILSTEPIDCEENYIQEDDVASGNIDPTVENPNAITLTEGNKYRLELSGGPWNTTRYDAAFSLDGGTAWSVISARPAESTVDLTPLEDIECSTSYADGVFVMYFTAPSTTFKIRVNDTPGAFANNTGSLTYRLTNVRAAGGECESQYSYDPEQNILASGTLILTDLNGQLLAAQPGSFAYEAASTSLSQSLGMVPAAIEPNQHYVLVLTGAWQDSSGGENKNTYQAKQASTGSWQNFGSTDQEGCLVTTSTSVSYYFQSNGDAILYVRPRSLDSNWTNNTGEVEWAVYGVTYTPRPNACSSTITIGELIGSGTVVGSKQDGIPLPNIHKVALPASGGVGDPVPQPDLVQRYVAIETEGGPWRDNGAQSYMLEITNDGGATWHSLDTWANCGLMLDNYHIRAYIAASRIWEHIPDTLDGNIVNTMVKLRASDGNNKFNDNTGSINFTWYQATNQDILQGSLGAGTCNANFSHAVSAMATIPVNAKSSSGVYLVDMPITSTVTLYALETTGAWQQTLGGDDLYDIQLSDDGGETWHEVTDYDPPIQCAQYIAEEDHHVLIYFAPISGTRYKVRVNDDTETWSTNPVGDLAVKVYTATGSFDAWEHCGSAYGLVPVGISNPESDLTKLQIALMDLDEWLGSNIAKLYALSVGFPSIEAFLPQGIPIEYQFNNGLMYAISTYAGGWGEACLGSCAGLQTNKNIEVSFNNGEVWHSLTSVPGKTCILDLESGHKRVYFAAPQNSNVVRLRVGGDDFANQGGTIDYIVFAVTGNSDSPIYTSSTVPNWAASCTTPCMAPALVATVDVAGVEIPVPNADFGAWLAYLGCRIEYFFSWCPEHTAMLINLFSYFRGYEPFGTIYEVISLIDSARAEAEAYTFVDECSPDPAFSEGGGDPVDSMIPSIGIDSPWNGGPAIAKPAVGGWSIGEGFTVSESTSLCYGHLSSLWGGQAAYGFMMAVEIMKRAFGGFVLAYIGIFFQAAIIGFGLAYIQKRWQVIAW